jgi:two-component system, OmpR family, sensor kinase
VSERTLRAIVSLWRHIDSLALRTTLVVLVGIGAVHLASLWTYQHSLSRELDLANEARLADQLLAIKRAVMRVPEKEREAVAHELSGGPIEAHWSRTEHAVAGGPGAGNWDALGQRLRNIAPEIADDGLVIGANRRVVDDPHLALISIRLPDLSWINVSLVTWSPRVPGGHGTLLSTSLMSLGAIIVSVLLVRWFTQPLTGFATASRALYRNRTTSLVPEEGPREVRDLAIAFNEMQRRIGRLIDERTQALAAVSHDLKTPITRLRFRVEEVPEPETRTAITADLDDMERMLDQTLAYLRGDRSDEELRPLDIVTILESITDDLSDRGHKVSLAGPASATVSGRRLALKRAFGNLIENAVKYGKVANVSVDTGPDAVLVAIRDHGPGIPPEDIERAFAPFVRLEASRNPETGGFGLGLTIAQAIIEGHGGKLSLANQADGGLIVSVQLEKRQSSG